MSGDDLLNSVLDILTEIPRERISDVSYEWIKKFHEVIRTASEYVSE
jgi:hypothetical protein